MSSEATTRRWIERRAASLGVRAIVVFGPLLASLVAAWALTKWSVTPSSMWLAFARWIAIALVSTAVLVVAERRFRKLLPLVALLRLSLSFPDRPPSRFRVAMRTTSTKQLEQRIEDAREGRLGDTPSEVATRVLELVAALNVHDPLTRGHSERVRAYGQMIGKEMKLSPQELDRLTWAGLLHDIGKLLVPTEILNKSGKLTDEEFDVIKLHPEYGQRLVEPLTGWLGESARAVWEHHERWSGGGYPRGISGTDISLAARIVSVADTFDVITSVRSYKARSSPKAARAELARCAGTQFDPAVVRAFMNASVGLYSWTSTPASWLAQTRLFPPAVLPAVVRAGVLASGAAFGGLMLAPVVAATSNEKPTPTTVTPIDDVEVEVENQPTTTVTSTASTSNTTARNRPSNPSGTTVPDVSSPDARPPIEPGVTVPVTTTLNTIPNTTIPNTAGPVTTTPVTTPDVTVPRVTTPNVTFPDATIPTVTIPTVTVPTGTVPNVTIPEVTIPTGTVPNGTIPDVTVPDLTDPAVTIPDVTLVGGL